jgi:hypothetical protein
VHHWAAGLAGLDMGRVTRWAAAATTGAALWRAAVARLLAVVTAAAAVAWLVGSAMGGR